MTASTRRLFEDLLRLAKSAIAVTERWLKEQPDEKSTSA